MTSVTQTTAAVATLQVDECNVAISTDTPTELSLAGTCKYERKCYFCGGVVFSGSECPAREDTATNEALKVTFQRYVGPRKPINLTK